MSILGFDTILENAGEAVNFNKSVDVENGVLQKWILGEPPVPKIRPGLKYSAEFIYFDCIWLDVKNLYCPSVWPSPALIFDLACGNNMFFNVVFM